MRRNSMVVPGQNKNKSSDQKHVFSAVLKSDARVATAPRFVETIHSEKGENGDRLYFVKVYAGPGEAGSELLTLSCVNSGTGVEVEFRFDERFPISIQVRKQSDPERLAYARAQIERAGGFVELLNLFRSSFPKVNV